MKPDSFTKSLLGAIAITLLVIAMKPWLRPITVAAQEKVDLSRAGKSVSAIESDVSYMESALPPIATVNPDRLAPADRDAMTE